MYFSIVLGAFGCGLVSAQTGVTQPLAQLCNATSLPNVLCLNNYTAVMPYHFSRNVSNATYMSVFGSTSVPNDTTFDQVNKTDFLVFDRKRGLDLLGPSPSYKFVFVVNKSVHEAPVYVASQNKLYFSQLAPPPGYLPQLVIDLNPTDPTLSPYLSDPPVYAPNGGTFHDGKIYWGASGGNNSIGGTEQRSGIRTLDPLTNKSTTLLNNYFGFYFNTVNDLVVSKNGDVWFTDPQYAWMNALTDTAPQLESATYRFRPSTGAVYVVEDSLLQPNGIGISPSGKTFYISDTGAQSGPIDRSVGPRGAFFNATGKRTIYAYDLNDKGTSLLNKRPIYLAQDGIPDGLKVAQNGYVVTAAGEGVDVLDEDGTLLVRVQTNYTVQNFAWTGKNLTTLWMFGSGGISKVEWNLQGQRLQ
ncbi:hypothetical protein MMC07_009246 [Pseudocyphellaria aurata]|nr:hypothetical protein [Pseudocyphellaria aurata]